MVRAETAAIRQDQPGCRPGIGETIQPGDLSMGMAAQEFLLADEDEEEEETRSDA